MKTWEMIKELTENPNKKFAKKDSAKNSYVTIANGAVVWLGKEQNGQNFRVTLLSNDGWEEVKEPVSFMEALEEVRNNPNIKLSLFYKVKGIKTDSVPLDELLLRLGADFYNATIVEILLGSEFYIED
jgi:hypothetical protein